MFFYLIKDIKVENRFPTSENSLKNWKINEEKCAEEREWKKKH